MLGNHRYLTVMYSVEEGTLFEKTISLHKKTAMDCLHACMYRYCQKGFAVVFIITHFLQGHAWQFYHFGPDYDAMLKCMVGAKGRLMILQVQQHLRFQAIHVISIGD